MPFRYGPNGERIEVMDSPNPQTIALLGRCQGMLEMIVAADANGALPDALKDAIGRLRENIEAHVKKLSGPD